MGPVRIWQALVEGGKASLFVAALTGAVGILIGVLALTGIGIRFSYILLEVAGKNLPADASFACCAQRSFWAWPCRSRPLISWLPSSRCRPSRILACRS